MHIHTPTYFLVRTTHLQVWRVFRQIVEGLSHIHEKGVCLIPASHTLPLPLLGYPCTPGLFVYAPQNEIRFILTCSLLNPLLGYSYTPRLFVFAPQSENDCSTESAFAQEIARGGLRKKFLQGFFALEKMRIERVRSLLSNENFKNKNGMNP